MPAFQLTSPDLAHHPFIFMEHIERLALRPTEVTALRQYLLSGGALLVTDFWGAMAWKNFQTEMQKVLPGRTWTDLSINHPIFRCVYDLRGPMSSLRVPSMQRWNTAYNPDDPNSNPPVRAQRWSRLPVCCFSTSQAEMPYLNHAASGPPRLTVQIVAQLEVEASKPMRRTAVKRLPVRYIIRRVNPPPNDHESFPFEKLSLARRGSRSPVGPTGCRPLNLAGATFHCRRA